MHTRTWKQVVSMFFLCVGVSACASVRVQIEPVHSSREEIFQSGYQRLQYLAQHEKNEHAALFVESRDGTFSWDMWVEGTPNRVSFPPEWINRLCRRDARSTTVAHTHVYDVPPSELDIAFTHLLTRELNKCNIKARSLVVAPIATWVLEVVRENWIIRGCSEYQQLWTIGARHPQRDIDKIFRNQQLFLQPYYRCAHKIRVHLFQNGPNASRK